MRLNKEEYLTYVDAEDEIEDMVCDGVLDIFVDPIGNFHYIPSKETLEMFGNTVIPQFADFGQFLQCRGLCIDKYRLYMQAVRKRNR